MRVETKSHATDKRRPCHSPWTVTPAETKANLPLSPQRSTQDIAINDQLSPTLSPRGTRLFLYSPRPPHRCRRKSRANTTTAAAAAPLPSTKKPPSSASANAVPLPSTISSVSKQQRRPPQNQTSKKPIANSACSPIRTRMATLAQMRLSKWLPAPLQS